MTNTTRKTNILEVLIKLLTENDPIKRMAMVNVIIKELEKIK